MIGVKSLMLDGGGHMLQAIDQFLPRNGFMVSFYKDDVSLFPSKITNVFVADITSFIAFSV
jgi:uncharacterized membrane protein YdjX (TVP38/TMEM64 family)